jgi:predicted transposase YbfD/YdcC
MEVSFLHYIQDVEDPRIAGMVVYALDEVLLTVLVGLLCRAEDFDEIELLCAEQLVWLRRILPFASGIAPAQTLRRTLSRLSPLQLERAFSAWTSSLKECLSGVVAIDGKTLRGSKRDADGADALHLVQAYAHEAGLVLAQRATDAKSNEITAIPAVLAMLELEGAIITIDAMGTQKDIAAQIIKKKADYVLALKGNQGSLYEDAALFFADPVLARGCARFERTDGGHGRVEERVCLAADASWLAARHPGWPALSSIVSVTARRTSKKTGATSEEQRFYISFLPPDPQTLADAVRAQWSIENNLNWQLDVTFREDECRTRKDHAARNLAMIRRAVLNMLRREPTKMPLKRKRFKALINPDFRKTILTY